MTDRRLCLFALQATSALGAAVAAALDQSLALHEERAFEDGEHKTRPLEPVRGADVYVLHSLNGETDQSANDKLCRLLFFIGALKDAGAARVTALAPYLCYSRKDRRTKPNDPVTTRYVAALFEAVGTDAVVTLDVHNPAAFENAFRRPTVALTAAPLFVDYAKVLGDARLCVVSPDTGGAKRADLFHEALAAALGRPVARLSPTSGAARGWFPAICLSATLTARPRSSSTISSAPAARWCGRRARPARPAPSA
jgi:ribose-phosphate pyrophosphokinase